MGREQIGGGGWGRGKKGTLARKHLNFEILFAHEWGSWLVRHDHLVLASAKT